MEAGTRIELVIAVLQTAALPLGDPASESFANCIKIALSVSSGTLSTNYVTTGPSWAHWHWKDREYR